MFTGTQANGDKTIPKTAGNIDEKDYNKFLNSNYQSKPHKRKRVSTDVSNNDKVVAFKRKQPISSSSKQPVVSSSKQPATSSSKQPVTSSSKQSIVSGLGIFVLSGKALSQFKNELAIWQKALSKLDQAICLLYVDYKNWLDLDSFVEAMNLFKDEKKTSMFLVMKSGDKRDQWLELQIDTEIDSLDVEWYYVHISSKTSPRSLITPVVFPHAFCNPISKSLHDFWRIAVVRFKYRLSWLVIIFFFYFKCPDFFFFQSEIIICIWSFTLTNKVM